jgi:prepilin-type N-terminal cleavage/methylation domain-containing protein
MALSRQTLVVSNQWSVDRVKPQCAPVRCTDHRSASPTADLGPLTSAERNPESVWGFTLLELLIVVGIIAVLLVLLAPAFTTIKSAGDVTSAAYTIKGVLDTARTYAKANNTYTWVGFFEEDVSQSSTNPATAGVGRLVMSIVASKDGTTTNLAQVGKLTKVENVHLTRSADSTSLPVDSNPQPPGTTLDTRPTVTATYCLGNTTSSTPFYYPLGATQYTFGWVVQFGSDGNARLSNSTDSPQPAVVAEIGLRQTHGTAVDMNSPNMVAIQFTGEGGNVTIYRK